MLIFMFVSFISSKSSWLQIKYEKIALILSSINWTACPCSFLSLKIENTEQHLCRQGSHVKKKNNKLENMFGLKSSLKKSGLRQNTMFALLALVEY